MVVHTRAKIGHHLKGPALAGTVQLQYLLLPFQIRFLVMAGHAGIGNGTKRRFWRMELLWAQPRQIIATTPARRAFVGDEFALALPAPQRLRRDAKERGRFANADHLA